MRAAPSCVLALVTLILAAGCGSVAADSQRTSATRHSERGVLTGAIVYSGGPPTPPGAAARSQAEPGHVKVYDAAGRVVAHARVRSGHHFRFALPAKSYRLTAGRSLDSSTCAARKAVVNAGRTTRVNAVCTVP